jgi:hypothetical protein
MKKLRRFISRHGLSIGVGSLLAFVIGLLFTYGVRTFLPGMSSAELQTIQQSSTVQAIIHNPLWLPQKLIDFGLFHLKVSGGTYRLTSGLFAVIIITSFYYICSKWYTTRVTVLSCCLFILSSTTLLLARTGTPAILLFAWVPITALVLWFRHSKHTKITPLFVLGALSLLLYVPGTIWFVGLLAIWFWRDIPVFFKHMDKRAVAAGGVLACIFIVPLAYAITKDWHIGLDWLLLPRSYHLSDSLDSLKAFPTVFFYKSALPAAYNLGKLPVFDALSGTLLLLGLYAYRSKLRLQRSIVYIVALLVSVTLAALNNNQLYLYLLLPFLYLLIGEGLGLLLHEWRAVFPRNPLARFIGTFILSIAVLTASSYHLNRYFLAWHNAPATKEIYSQKLQT